MIKVSDYVMNFLADLGVKDIFFLPGGGCMHLVDSLGRCKRIGQVANLNEQCAAIGASAYSQYTGEMGVCLVTAGPGGTNAVTGVAAAWIDSNPVLVLSGQAKRADLKATRGVRQMGPQEVDLPKMVADVTKYAVTIMEPEAIRYHLEKAVYEATTGRKGPVWLELPLDVQGAIVEETTLKGYEKYSEMCFKACVSLEGQDIEQLEKQSGDLASQAKQAIELINQAERPVILAGVGIRKADGIQEFLELAEKLRIPVLTTWRSIDIMEETHPLYFGRPGAVGQRGANFILQNSDLLITIGARMDLCHIGFSYENLARVAKKIVVDIDQTEIKKLEMSIDLPIVSDAKDFIQAVTDALNLSVTLNNAEVQGKSNLPAERNMMTARDITPWLKRCREWKGKYPVVKDGFPKETGMVNTYKFIDVLSDILDDTALIVPGSSGTCSEVTSQAIRIKKGQRFINSPGLGSMGFGVAESIGVCIAGGRKKTVCIIGDGGLQHNIQELELLKRYQLPIKLFVLNNNAYASIRSMQNRTFEGNLVGCDDSCGLTLPDTLKIAEAYGLKTYKIENHEGMAEKISEIMAGNEPAVCELMIDPDMQTAPRVSSMAMPDGRMVSKPLEDLWPFLERKEFKENMLIDILE